MNLLNRTLLPLLTLLACTGPALAQAAAGHNRIVDSADITYTPLSSGGWQITARAYASNLTTSAVDLSSTLTIALNNVVIGTATQTMLITGVTSGSASPCTNTCAENTCTGRCKESIVTQSCWCSKASIDAYAIVPALHPGDVITAFVTPAPGAAAEAIAGDDWGFAAVPPHVRWNRKLPADSLTYQPAPDGSGFVITGDVGIAVTYGDSGNLSCYITVYSGTTTIGGGHGGTGGGTCGSTDLITFGPGYPHNPLVGIWDCTPFCAGCTGYDINICQPPGLSGSPWCMCQQMCAARTVPGHHWEVQVPPLNPDAFITIGLSPLPGSLSEIDSSDDAVTVQVRDITPCPADMGSQGGLPGRDFLLDNNDFVVFIDFFFTGDTRADLGVQGGTSGHDGHFDNNDFVVFIDQFFTGC